MSSVPVSFFLLSAVIGLLQIPSGASQCYVKPSDTSACPSMNASSTCMTLDDYAKALNSNRKNITCIDGMDVTMIFLPGKHILKEELYIHSKTALEMVKDDAQAYDSSCHHEVEIQLYNANISFCMISSVTLADLMITHTGNVKSSLILNNIPWPHNDSVILNITNVRLKRSAMKFECDNCTGEVNLSNRIFDASYADFRIENSHDMSVVIQNVNLMLDSSQTGLAFYSLQLNILLMDNITTSDLNESEIDITTHKTNPTYDLHLIRLISLT